MVHIGTRQIETERLILRRFTMEDVGDAFYGWFSDPDVAMYMRWDAHSDISQTQEFIAHFVADFSVCKKREYHVANNKSYIGAKRNPVPRPRAHFAV